MNHPDPTQGGGAEAPRRDALQLIIECLVAHGWMTDRVVTNTVTKEFMTAVGPKQASIWVAYSRGADSHLLTGQYESQGNNVLSTCWSWIAATARKSEIDTTVDEHLAKVAHAIGETYAVRLLKHCTPRPGA